MEKIQWALISIIQKCHIIILLVDEKNLIKGIENKNKDHEKKRFNMIQV